MFFPLAYSPEPPMLTVRSGTRRIHGNGALMIPGPGFGPGIGVGSISMGGRGRLKTGGQSPLNGPGPSHGPTTGGNGVGSNTGSLYATPQASQSSANPDTSPR